VNAHDLAAVEDDEGGLHALAVAEMGSIPSCRSAHTTLGILTFQPSPVRQPVATATFVDNVGFFGTAVASAAAMATFAARCERVGALLNNEEHGPQQRFEFLGERYDLVDKTRTLTTKVREKVDYIASAAAELLRKRKTITMTARRLLAIIGTLRYAADTLDLPLAKHMEALRMQVEAAREGARSGFESRVCVPRQAMEQIEQWATAAATSEPVHVVEGRRTHAPNGRAVEIYVDASAWGYGAIIVDGNNVRHISNPWCVGDAEHVTAQGVHLGSSVFAEPLALRKVLCSVGQKQLQRACTTIYSDHMGMTGLFVGNASYSLTPSYNAAIELVQELAASGYDVRVQFVPGANNPADPLSRGYATAAPLLQVTKIGAAHG
jgi:hypothetical protein